MTLPCNFAIARFLADPKTRVFVNVGATLICPEAAFFEFQLVSAEQSVPSACLTYFSGQLASLGESLRLHNANTGGAFFETDHALGMFRELVRPRDPHYRFSVPRTALIADPAQYLRALYAFYVEWPLAMKLEQEAVK